jgi:hypothetical protein
VKFLLFQFALYAFVAMVVGALLALVWARVTSQALRRALDRTQQALGQESESNVRLRASRMADQKLIGEATDLASKLLELRSALALVEADVRANQMARADAERSRDLALSKLDIERGSASRVARLTDELSLRVAERNEIRESLELSQREASAMLRTVQTENEHLRATLTHLSKTHDALVVASQEALTAAEMRAEDAVAASVSLARENAQLIAEVYASRPDRVIVLNDQLVPPTVGDPFNSDSFDGDSFDESSLALFGTVAT